MPDTVICASCRQPIALTPDERSAVQDLVRRHGTDGDFIGPCCAGKLRRFLGQSTDEPIVLARAEA